MITVKISLGGNTFEANGDALTTEELQPIFETWVRAQKRDDLTLAQLTKDAKANNDALQAVVDANKGVLEGEVKNG